MNSQNLGVGNREHNSWFLLRLVFNLNTSFLTSGYGFEKSCKSVDINVSKKTI